MPTTNHNTGAWSKPSTTTPDVPEKVVVVDPVTADPVGVEPAVPPNPPTDLELLNAEHELPEGTAPVAHERRFTPWVMGGLGLLGLVLVGGVMLWVGGLDAMFVGIMWMIAGYSVAWIVVWAAGLLRARDEKNVEEAVCAQKNPHTGACEDLRAKPPSGG